MVNHLPSAARMRYCRRAGQRIGRAQGVIASAPVGAVPESRRDWLLRWLRAAIAGGELKPGDRLVERDISARSGVSRGPVREAIMLLEQEGLVVTHPYRGAEVARVSQREVREVLVPMRLIIERFAFREVGAAPERDLLDRLATLVAQMRTAADGAQAERLADLDVEFHEAVIKSAGHPQTLQIWRTIQPRVRAYFVRDAPAHARPDEIPEQHQGLLDVLRSADLAAIDAAVVAHIEAYLDPS